MRVIIAGSRKFNNPAILYDAVRKSGFDITTVISGTARGADQLGEQYARHHNLGLGRYPADWDKYGKSAGYRRNAVMADNADGLIALWDGQSKGTEHMIKLTESKNLHVFCYCYSDLIQTSTFHKCRDNGLNIAIKPPSWFRGDSYPDLFPRWDFLNDYKRTGDMTAYTNAYYNQILSKLDPFSVWSTIKGQTLLCWEKPGDFCHRRIVAGWLEMNLGVFVPERV